MEGNNNEAPKEPKLSCCTRFKNSMHNTGRFIYNPDTKEVLGRGGISWLQILAFYLGFYCVLAAFWATCMVGFLRTLDPVVPTMQKMYSMMKDNPGMSFEPFPDTSTTLIRFYKDDNSSYDPYITRLSSVYLDYENRSMVYAGDSTHKDCSDGDGATYDKSCRFDITSLGDVCTPSNNFSYPTGKPCVLLRINRVFLWQPNDATFDNESKCSSPADQAKSKCKNQVAFMALPSKLRSAIQPGYISVSCEGENDGDSDNIIRVQFYPKGGFSAYYYPYYNQPQYISPFVMAQFEVVPGRASLILCKVWTRDIIHDKNDLQGSIHFELFVDP